MCTCNCKVKYKFESQTPLSDKTLILTNEQAYEASTYHGQMVSETMSINTDGF